MTMVPNIIEATINQTPSPRLPNYAYVLADSLPWASIHPLFKFKAEGMVEHAFNPSTGKAEANRSL